MNQRQDQKKFSAKANDIPCFQQLVSDKRCLLTCDGLCMFYVLHIHRSMTWVGVCATEILYFGYSQ